MATLRDICSSAAVNLLSAVAFLVAFAILRLQPINDRVYFPKWYLKGIRGSPTRSGALVGKFVNLDCSAYLRFLNWMPAALRMPEPELIDHAGLDSAVYIRIYILGLKIFVPITLLSLTVLVPINLTGDRLDGSRDPLYSNIDKLSISNIPHASKRFWVHVAMAYVFTFWTLYVQYNEYRIIASKRLQFLASQDRRPDQFTVLVRNVPPDPDETVSEHVEHFFCVNHPDHYLIHQVVCNANRLANLVEKKKSLQNWLIYYQNKHERSPSKRKPTMKTGFMGLWGTTVDAIDHYTAEIEKLSAEENAEREKVANDPNSIVQAAFVSFKTRWAAAVCAQTQQSSNPTLWLTEWAPQPQDVYWPNLRIPYVELNIRRLLIVVGLFFLVFCFMIPIAFVQSLANIEKIQRAPLLQKILEIEVVKSIIKGVLPGFVLKLFLIVLPIILMAMSKLEGHTSLSTLDRKSAAKYHLFILVNIFVGSIITGTAIAQLQKFINEPPSEIPEVIGKSIPQKATFFITYIMVDGWAGVAAEILRLVPFVLFHLNNTFLVKTDKDRELAMDPGNLNFAVCEPRIQLYFLLGLVYSTITPILLPFIVVFFAFSYVVFRHQIINVYDQKYESGAAFWPDVHLRLIISLIISQLLLMGFLRTEDAVESTPVLLVLPILTIWFHCVCKGRFESAFVKFPLQDAMVKDTLEKATDPTLNLKSYIQDAYLHPVFRGSDFDRPKAIDEEEESPLVATKRRTNSQRKSKVGSEVSSGTAKRDA